MRYIWSKIISSLGSISTSCPSATELLPTNYVLANSPEQIGSTYLKSRRFDFLFSHGNGKQTSCLTEYANILYHSHAAKTARIAPDYAEGPCGTPGVPRRTVCCEMRPWDFFVNHFTLVWRGSWTRQSTNRNSPKPIARLRQRLPTATLPHSNVVTTTRTQVRAMCSSLRPWDGCVFLMAMPPYLSAVGVLRKLRVSCRVSLEREIVLSVLFTKGTRVAL